MLIPPSLLLIIYGVLAEVSIGALFLAAVLPGILLAVAFAVGVVLMAWLWPSFVGNVRRDAPPEHDDGALGVLAGLVPVVALIVLVLGGIYGGVFTPTEAGAAGALGAMVIALVKRRLTLAQALGRHERDGAGLRLDPVPDHRGQHVQPHADADRAAARHGGVPRQHGAWASAGFLGRVSGAVARCSACCSTRRRSC